MALMQVDELSLSYDGRQRALDRVSFSMGQGEILAIVGESGSGKSTLLRAILGMLPPSVSMLGGRVVFRGREVSGDASAPLPFVRGKDVAMIFQHPAQSLNPSRRIGAQFDEFLRVHGVFSRSERAAVATTMLQRLQLAEPERVLRSHPFELSGGMMQRVCLAMAMSLRPSLLLADEPTSALDVVTQSQVADQLAELNREDGVAILLVTHNMGLADRLAHRIGVMRQGELVEIGPREQVVHAPQHDYTKQLLRAARA